jgi:carboxypeptidase Q
LNNTAQRIACSVVLAAIAVSHARAQTAADLRRLQPAARRITAAALADSLPYRRLAALVDGFGHRLSGSVALEQAIDWVLVEMQRDGFANVRGEPVMVPHWVRGAESATLLSPRQTPLHMLGLGGSVGTGPDGVTGEVLVVHSFDELERRRAEAVGKIVLFNVPSRRILRRSPATTWQCAIAVLVHRPRQK